MREGLRCTLIMQDPTGLSIRLRRGHGPSPRTAGSRTAWCCCSLRGHQCSTRAWSRPTTIMVHHHTTIMARSQVTRRPNVCLAPQNPHARFRVRRLHAPGVCVNFALPSSAYMSPHTGSYNPSPITSPRGAPSPSFASEYRPPPSPAICVPLV